MGITKIDRENALRYMGYREAPDERTTALIDKCEERLLKAAVPRCLWRLFDIEREPNNSGDGLRLSGCGFALEGKSIREHLEGCSKAAVIVATLSADIDRFLKKEALKDKLTGLILDALASVLVEQTSERGRSEVLEVPDGISGTWIFAAGYGDFPLETNRFLIDCVDAGRRIGVSCTDSYMLIPQKTIVGIMGVSEEPVEKARRGCESCNMKESCQFRKNGLHCN